MVGVGPNALMEKMKMKRQAIPMGFFQMLRAKYRRAAFEPWMEEVRADRKAAIDGFISEAELKARCRDELDRLALKLKALGPKYTRLKALPGREAEAEQVGKEMRSCQVTRLSIQRACADLKRQAKWWQRRVMVRLYEKRPRGQRGIMKQICKWLSVPEIGIRCTPGTIRAARRHSSDQIWRDSDTGVEHWLPVYCDSQGPPQRVAPEFKDRVFSCLLCGKRAMSRHEFRAHLTETHNLLEQDLYVPKRSREFRREGTDEPIGASYPDRALEVLSLGPFHGRDGLTEDGSLIAVSIPEVQDAVSEKRCSDPYHSAACMGGH
jgi:hypothetical protein